MSFAEKSVAILECSSWSVFTLQMSQAQQIGNYVSKLFRSAITCIERGIGVCSYVKFYSLDPISKIRFFSNLVL